MVSERRASVCVCVCVCECECLATRVTEGAHRAIMIVLWRLIHTVGLGVVLHYQSHYDMMVKRFIAQVWFAALCERGAPTVIDALQGWTREDAFDSWKKIYNTSATMQWVVFFTAAW